MGWVGLGRGVPMAGWVRGVRLAAEPGTRACVPSWPKSGNEAAPEGRREEAMSGEKRRGDRGWAICTDSLCCTPHSTDQHVPRHTAAQGNAANEAHTVQCMRLHDRKQANIYTDSNGLEYSDKKASKQNKKRNKILWRNSGIPLPAQNRGRMVKFFSISELIGLRLL